MTEPSQLALEHSKPKLLPLSIAGNRSLGIFVEGQSDIAVLLVSGGAQVRAGSHRMQQQLASYLQQQQISSLRFDFPGYGDAEGQPADFIQHAQWLPEILTAAQQAQPQIRRWLLFGLCDGASAILLNQQLLPQTAGLILLNPWCRAEQNHAKTMVRFYYWQRLWSAEFWQKLLSGRSQPLQSLQQFLQYWWQARANLNPKNANGSPDLQPTQGSNQQFLPAMLHNWQQYAKPVLLALSENDLTAQECASLLAELPATQRQQIARHTTTKTVAKANHTCSDATHFLQLQRVIKDWLLQNFSQ
ncbi:hydrolase 1, exosortase A system-associated [Rheinheimera riviphila]|uniref:Hydrolase 1, exosortase A system-associated n=1 Tax=Rheinheimera riviphila TaxID=1834037 RepID=A0A437QSW2_9GAMM|nr:hydrolase 1, exosortase A system-associated [Rheinheimera riviphila]RVU37597.1 hydrolase 1, exosortase A system-associated [Rheinheimera riviphila]